MFVLVANVPARFDQKMSPENGQKVMKILKEAKKNLPEAFSASVPGQ